MGHTASRQFRKSNNRLHKKKNIQINSRQVNTNENIFKLHDNSKQPSLHHLTDQFTLASSSNYQSSFEQALIDSLYNSTNPRPLALYIYDEQSSATDIFNELVFNSDSINTYLSEEFILWKWNLTEGDYQELLTIVTKHANKQVAEIIDSTSTEIYPLIICLIFDHGQIKIESVIQGIMSDSEIFALLIQTRDAFGARFDLPNTNGLNLRNISTENWSIPKSTLIQVSKESNEFRRVAADFHDGASSIVRIDRIENSTWLIQYLNQKQMIDARLGHDHTEKLLFHGCPYAAAKKILQQAFDHDRIGTHGSYCGHGFYFSTNWHVSDGYAKPNPSTGEKRILMCRVLVGRSCEGNSTMKTCPLNYDSTTGGLDTYVVYSNRHVLPEYLITYK
ncbi:unnamed protein product [Rotaria sp. Silwood1]|nr:unnamed protein product [Rotaria sp. Silwood1]CAF3686128.1 unnamed protein product [Rotaria sp. Silwood1]